MQKNEPPTAEQIAEAKKAELAKIMELPRTQRRPRLRIRQPIVRRPYSRVRSGIPTGTTSHFRSWMAELSYKSALSGMRLDHLADTLDGRLASTFALLRVSGGIKDVWQLSKADVSALLAIPQVGPARLAEVEKYLLGKNVPLSWTAA